MDWRPGALDVSVEDYMVTMGWNEKLPKVKQYLDILLLLLLFRYYIENLFSRFVWCLHSDVLHLGECVSFLPFLPTICYP